MGKDSAPTALIPARRMSLFGTIRAFLLGVISAVVFACGGENFDKIRNIDSAGETIICFGDSLTEGVGAAEGEDYRPFCRGYWRRWSPMRDSAAISVHEINRSSGNPKIG